MQNLILTPLQKAFFRSLSNEEQAAIARIYFGVDALNPADDADINYKVFMALGRAEAAEAFATVAGASAPSKAEAPATSTPAASTESDSSKKSDLVDAPTAPTQAAPTAPTQAAPTSATAPMSAVATASTAPQRAVVDSHVVDEFSHELVDYRQGCHPR